MIEYKKITVQSRQCIEDIAIQEYGDVAGTEHLLNDNRLILVDGFDTQLHQGMILKIRDGEPVDEKVLPEIKKRQIEPATGELYEPITGPDYNNDHNDDHKV